MTVSFCAVRQVVSGKLEVEVLILATVRLPADFMVWVTSPEARFLRGKFVYANWDVDELKARAEEIEATPILTSNVLGWPFEPA